MVIKFRDTAPEDAESIYNLVQETIKAIYPKYYPTEVVDFFSKLHCIENIKRDIEENLVFVAEIGDIIAATGCLKDNHITRVFVDPEFQGHGLGSNMMERLENKISKDYDKAVLDSSLAASCFYEQRGYKTVEHAQFDCANNKVLVYEIMEKSLSRILTPINYDGKIFVSKSNTENGEVDNNTVFSYHQNGDIFSADYSGGEIIKGFIIGTVSENGELDFHYQHININREIKIGKCHSVPHITDSGKIELHEEWQWLNGDKTNGSSILVEK